MAVYVIGCDGSRLVKIGYSRDPSTRLAELGRMSANPVELRWQSGPEYGIEAEQHLHKLFRDYRRHGEWFDFGEEDPVSLVRSALDVPIPMSLRKTQGVTSRDWSNFTRHDLLRELAQLCMKQSEIAVVAAECRALIELMDQAPDAQTVIEALESRQVKV